MTGINNYGIKGIGSIVQFGKAGLKLVTDAFAFKATKEDGSTLVPFSGADPRSGSAGMQDFITKAYFQNNGSKTLVVANLAERDALTGVLVGNSVYVQDATGEPGLAPGRYALYLLTGNGWALISTEDSSEADEGSVSIDVDPTVSSTQVLYTLRPNQRVLGVNVLVPAALSNDATLSVGIQSAPDLFMQITENDLAMIDDYYTITNYKVTSPTDIKYVYNAGTNVVATSFTITVFFGS